MSRMRGVLRLFYEGARKGAEHEIYFDDEHHEGGFRGVSRLAQERHPGAYRIHEEIEYGTPRTDGVFPESKEFLAGYWIVDVDTPEQAYAIAARASAAPGLDGAPLNM